MQRNSRLDNRIRTAIAVVADTLAYVMLVTAIAVVGSAVAMILTGGGPVRLKVFLFIIGFGLMAYSTVRLWPRSIAELENEDSIPNVDELTRFQRIARNLPPARWLPSPPPARELSPPAKLFWGSLTILLISLSMETIFGVS